MRPETHNSPIRQGRREAAGRVAAGKDRRASRTEQDCCSPASPSWRLVQASRPRRQTTRRCRRRAARRPTVPRRRGRRAARAAPASPARCAPTPTRRARSYAEACTAAARRFAPADQTARARLRSHRPAAHQAGDDPRRSAQGPRARAADAGLQPSLPPTCRPAARSGPASSRSSPICTPARWSAIPGMTEVLDGLFGLKLSEGAIANMLAARRRRSPRPLPTSPRPCAKAPSSPATRPRPGSAARRSGSGRSRRDGRVPHDRPNAGQVRAGRVPGRCQAQGVALRSAGGAGQPRRSASGLPRAPDPRRAISPSMPATRFSRQPSSASCKKPAPSAGAAQTLPTAPSPATPAICGATSIACSR